MSNKSFENDLVSFEVREGILYGRYKVAEIDLDMAKLATLFRKQITEGKPMPAIADISVVKQVPKDTREYFSSVQAGEDLAALAVIINNPVTRIMGNFFLKFHQPQYPFRFFTSVDEATNWIKQFV
jgi:hypothetical protein